MKRYLRFSTQAILRFTLCLSLVLTLQVPAVASAQQSSDDINSIVGNTPFYDPNACGAGQTAVTTNVNVGSVTINGQTIQINKNEITAYQFFTSNGFTATQAAGIVGNLMEESTGVTPTSNPSSGVYGIAQWTPPTAMEAYAAAHGLDYTTLQAQLDFLLSDLHSGNSAADAAVKATSTVDAATAAFMNGYERPSVPALNVRELDANAIFTYMGGQPGGSGLGSNGNGANCVSNGTGPGSSGTCTTATGDIKILECAKQYAGIYYVWGGAHAGYGPFRAACPISSIAGWTTKSTAANPGPCGTDCSGLVSVAVDQAFNQSFMWTVAGTMNGAGATHWHPISMNQLQPGDIVTTSEHVEIVDHVSGNNIYTFGSHFTGSRTGPSPPTPIGSYYTGAYRYQ